MFIAVGDRISNVEGYHQYVAGCSVLQGDAFSTVEGVQTMDGNHKYSGYYLNSSCCFLHSTEHPPFTAFLEGIFPQYWW